MSRIKNITRIEVEEEEFYNLAVEADESYIANGIVVHNCRSVLIPITRFEAAKIDTKVDTKDGKKNIDTFIEDETGKGFARR